MLGGFRLFGPDHLGALGATLVLSLVAIAWARRRRGSPGTRAFSRALALVILLSQAADPIVQHVNGTLSLDRSLPLDLCDLAGFVCIIALWTGRQIPFEFAWFWGLSGTLQAVLTPAVKVGFPDPEYLRFFVLHGGIVLAVLYMGPGLGRAPRRGAVWKVYGWTAVYTVLVGLVDWALDANYFFLCRKPPGSLLDWFGPWPWYILGGAAIAAVFFFLLDLPFRISTQRRWAVIRRKHLKKNRL
jgi:hypothetical integral membrane protein (TIGR02206 family)